MRLILQREASTIAVEPVISSAIMFCYSGHDTSSTSYVEQFDLMRQLEPKDVLRILPTRVKPI